MSFENKLWGKLLAIFFLSTGISSAADVAPFFFANASGQDAETQEAEWNYLMKYKMFGAHGINFNNTLIRVTDSVGWFGTAAGDLNLMHNGLDTIGGPILVGGNLNFHMGPEVFTNGPVNVTGKITVDDTTNFKSKGNLFYGEQCVKEEVHYLYPSFVDPIGNDPDSVAKRSAKLHFGETAYNDCFDETKGLKVPAVNENLRIPTLENDPETYSTELRTRVHKIEGDALVLEQGKTGTFVWDSLKPNNQVLEVYIPWGDSKEYYDIYLDSMNFSNSATLLFNMQPGGRLTRVFLKKGITGFSSFSNIAVQYAEYDDDGNVKKESNGDTTYVRQANADYNGTLLFYTPKDIVFPSFAGGSSIQGSFISAGKITIADHMILAGQLLADVININANFDGKNFIFVPFNPTTLDFDPTALAEGKFIENDSTVLVPIKLDTLASVDVSFKYCFDIKDSSLTDPNSKIASIQDFNNITPVCGKDTGSVKILADDTIPRGIYNVYINVAIDTLFEGQETLPMKVFGLAGAVLPGNKRQGSFSLPIIDDPTPASLKKIVLDSVPENSPVGTRIDSLIAIRGDKLCTHCKFALVDSTDYVNVSESGLVTVKDSSILDYESITEIKIRVFVIDTQYQKISDTTVTIPVLNVNEDPIINEDQEFDVDEHQVPGTVVGTVEWGEHDSVPEFRQDLFEAFGGATDKFTISPTGVITTKKELDYETMDTTYILVIKLVDKIDPNLFDIDTVVIHVHNLNENPKITTEVVKVTENSEVGTIVDTLEATDVDFGDTVFTWTLLEDPSGCFDVSKEGVVTVKACSNLDYEKNTSIPIKVKAEDGHGGFDTKVINVNIIDVPSPSIEIVKAENPERTWKNPDSIYTNIDDITLYCSVNRAAEKLCADTTLQEGRNVIVEKICDVAGFEGCAIDSVVVFLSTAAPVVIVSADPAAKRATNIYTIVEQQDSTDTNIYVNSKKNDIYVTIKDSVTKKDTSFTVNLELVTLTVPKNTYSKLSSVAKEGVALNENPKGVVERTPMNGTEVKVSYTEKVAGIDVTVTYMTDKKGNVIKQAVVNEKGKVDSVEVITVSYETEIDGKIVLVSYVADAVTGARLAKDASGKLVTQSSDTAGVYSVTYDYVDKNGNSVVVSYTVDEKGNFIKDSEGNSGYEVSYTYENKYGNAATQSVFIVLDQVKPKVEILNPTAGQVIHSNFVNVEWTVDGVTQDSLVLQGLEKGPNVIVRMYRDKAGNEAYDSVFVIMKDTKNVDIAVEQPVTEIDKDKVAKYYADHKPKDGETFAVSVRNPSTGKEVETLIGGDFKTTDGSGEAPYPGLDEEGATHLGPTLTMDVKLPVVSGVSGLATMDDLLSSDGMIPLEGVDADSSHKITVAEYVQKYCDADVSASGDLSRINLYNTKMAVKIWVFSTLGNFVDYYDFTQKLNDPDYANDAGLLKMYFEMKPDVDGHVRAGNEKLLGTGAYVYKVEAVMRSTLRCTLPSDDYDPVTEKFGSKAKKRGDVIKSDDRLLKPFGYKRPKEK